MPAPTAVISRLLEDEYVQEQLSTGASQLRAAVRRARAMRAEEAAQDKKLYEHAREAVGSLTAAARRALGKPEPEPPRRRGRRLAILAIGISVLALVRSMHRAQQARPSASAPAPQE